MADLTADRQVDTKQLNVAEGGYYMDFDVAANETIFQGSFVQGDAGGDIVSAGSDTVGFGAVWGLAVENVVNTTAAGGGSDGDKTAKCLVGAVIEHTLTATTANIGQAVFVSDDQTLSLTAQGNAFLGTIIGMNTANTVIVQMIGPTDRGAAFTVTNFTADFALNADDTTVTNTNDVLATVIRELIDHGYLTGTTAA